MRRAITLGSAFPFASSLAFESSREAGAQEVSDRPNILFIMTDDQTYDSLDEMAGTSLDPMAQTKAALGPGVRFNRAYAASALCAPSRTSMLTGLYPHNPKNGIQLNYKACPIYRHSGLHRISAAQYLADSGYNCGYFGKFMNKYEETAAWWPSAYNGWISTLHDTDPVKANMGGKVREPRQANGSHVMRREESGWLAARALNFIEAQPTTEPWFVTVAFSNPHNPYDPSGAHKGAYDNVTRTSQGILKDSFDHYDPGKPRFFNPAQPMDADLKLKCRDHWRGKMEELMDVDDAIASLCASVDFEETYVFFVTDNGFVLGEHRVFAKGVPYEESVRLPLFVRGPGTRENAVSDLLVGGCDLPATIMELAGLDPVEAGMDGRSLVGPLFTDDETTLGWRDRLLIEQPMPFTLTPQAWYATRTDDAYYIEYSGGGKEYYDMVNDPEQLTNTVTEQDPVTLYEMSARLSGMKGATGEELRLKEVPAELSVDVVEGSGASYPTDVLIDDPAN